jgi:hypothetical protein
VPSCASSSALPPTAWYAHSSDVRTPTSGKEVTELEGRASGVATSSDQLHGEIDKEPGEVDFRRGRPAEDAGKVFDATPTPGTWRRAEDRTRSALTSLGSAATNFALGCGDPTGLRCGRWDDEASAAMASHRLLLLVCPASIPHVQPSCSRRAAVVQPSIGAGHMRAFWPAASRFAEKKAKIWTTLKFRGL